MKKKRARGISCWTILKLHDNCFSLRNVCYIIIIIESVSSYLTLRVLWSLCCCIIWLYHHGRFAISHCLNWEILLGYWCQFQVKRYILLIIFQYEKSKRQFLQFYSTENFSESLNPNNIIFAPFVLYDNTHVRCQYGWILLYLVPCRHAQACPNLLKTLFWPHNLKGPGQ